ncbi:riboflavin-specific deaminase-like protein [Roseinatronobacter thiooxidans]|uniref:Riboflavin-specific deaminase-like protein n=1 Tax=Roseinatronobacter thiooxidans TaxID=121821 RepID=A0A2W7QER9_9RHOB|nr:RibD family protein [Roseinatronobacter thiooxidans]PZX45896.1 riboflavin-specific deaminase-like protein [Roseinatronobacter thiooxidans]
MLFVDVTPKAWARILDIRRGRACACCGRWSAGERAALDLYGPLARRDLGPVTVGQIGQSLDGRVATVTGDARDVSGPDGLAHLHRMRALVDGVVIGVRTALHDSSRLTVRLCDGPNPDRIVIDPQGRLPDDAPALRDDGARRFVIQAVDRTRPNGVQVIRLDRHKNQLDPAEISARLRAEGLHSLLIEGGGITIARFLEAGLLTRLQVAIAPLLIGGGPQGLTLPSPSAELANALRPQMRAFSLGSDVLFDCGFTPAAAEAEQPQHIGLLDKSTG